MTIGAPPDVGAAGLKIVENGNAASHTDNALLFPTLRDLVDTCQAGVRLVRWVHTKQGPPPQGTRRCQCGTAISAPDTACTTCASRPASLPAPGWKPGDWECRACGDHVFASKSMCRCGYARIATPAENPSPVQPPVRLEATLPPGWKHGDWMCPACGDHVFASKASCRCGAKNPTLKSEPASQGSTSTQIGWKPGDWRCPTCGDHVFASKAACGRCGAPKNRPTPVAPSQGPNPSRKTGDWQCPSCGDSVFASRTHCRLCHTPRPT